ncbi:MAG: ParB N-terminal domain-containing protein [Pseudomonadota bacterium]
MSRKRRIFDVEMPDGVPAGTETEARSGRRGPMAAAIGDAADALRQRQAQEAAIRAENDGLAHEYVALQRAGLVVRKVPLEQIRATKLIRDRNTADDPALGELVVSLREVGLSNPIRLEEWSEGGSYELIQGYRRLEAYRALLSETGDAEVWGAIPALVTPQGPALEELYRRMVDENLIRKDISFAEMAQLAAAYAADPSTKAESVQDAVVALYGSSGRQKQSYIRKFATLLSYIEKELSHPAAIPRALGLAVLRRIEAEEGAVQRLVEALRQKVGQGEDAERDVLQAFADGAPAEEAAIDLSPRGQLQDRSAPRQAKTTFRISRPEGVAKCTATVDRVEVQLARDFTAVDRRKLEAAIAAFLDVLDQ